MPPPCRSAFSSSAPDGLADARGRDAGEQPSGTRTLRARPAARSRGCHSSTTVRQDLAQVRGLGTGGAGRAGGLQQLVEHRGQALGLLQRGSRLPHGRPGRGAWSARRAAAAARSAGCAAGARRRRRGCARAGRARRARRRTCRARRRPGPARGCRAGPGSGGSRRRRAGRRGRRRRAAARPAAGRSPWRRRRPSPTDSTMSSTTTSVTCICSVRITVRGSASVIDAAGPDRQRLGDRVGPDVRAEELDRPAGLLQRQPPAATGRRARSASWSRCRTSRGRRAGTRPVRARSRGRPG